MSNGKGQTGAYAVAAVLVGIGIVLIVSKCDKSPSVPTEQRTAHPEKRERPIRSTPGPKPVEISAASKTDAAWDDPQSDRAVKVRRTLLMTATPAIREEGDRATAEILLDFKEGADVWDEIRSDWRPMDEEEFGRWSENSPNRDRITYSATASITKVIDDATGELRIESVSAFGASREDPNKDWSRAENGMSVFLDWKDDQLVVKWSSIAALGVEPVVRSVAIPFSARFSSPVQ